MLCLKNQAGNLKAAAIAVCVTASIACSSGGDDTGTNTGTDAGAIPFDGGPNTTLNPPAAVTTCQSFGHLPVTNGATPARQPALHWDGQKYLVTWNDGTAGTIMGAILNKDGVRQGEPMQLATDSGFGLSPEIARTSNGYVLVWEACAMRSGESCIGGSAVKSVALNANGTPTGSVNEISPAMMVQRRPYIVAAFGRTYVVFREMSGAKTLVKVVALGTNGELLQSPAPLALEGAGDTLFPAIAASPSNLGVSYVDGADLSQVKLAILDANLTKTGEAVLRAQMPGSATNTAVTWTGSGWLTAWEDTRSGSAQIYTAAANGSAAQAAIPVHSENGNWPTLAAKNGSSALVAFYGFPKGAQVMMTRLTPQGQLAETVGQVTMEKVSGGKFPALVYNDKDDQYAMVFEESGSGQAFIARVKCP